MNLVHQVDKANADEMVNSVMRHEGTQSPHQPPKGTPTVSINQEEKILSSSLNRFPVLDPDFGEKLQINSQPDQLDKDTIPKEQSTQGMDIQLDPIGDSLSEGAAMSDNMGMGVPFSKSCPTSVANSDDDEPLAGTTKPKKGKHTTIAGQRRITCSITEKSMSLNI